MFHKRSYDAYLTGLRMGKTFGMKQAQGANLEYSQHTAIPCARRAQLSLTANFQSLEIQQLAMGLSGLPALPRKSSSLPVKEGNSRVHPANADTREATKKI
jgi:hypothetical protein